ncbi:MAG TPA: Bug family tripartite tricarboxylate transporter substrate binding protein [Burkholderiaceae bacterium]|nr:Bug family tripartite tricarboxylate transporter substrate binding protein [Burkholderiaceae bacterium]
MNLGWVAALLLAGSLSAGAQDPKGPLRIVVGYPAGGSADVVGRLVGEKLALELKVPVIVENKVGAGGRVAAESMKSAPADGSTIMVGNIAVMTLAQFSFRKLAYDGTRDFVPITHAANFQLGFAVGPMTGAAAPAATLDDFVKWARANPKDAAFGSPAAGSLPHFFGVMLSKGTGVELLHVPYNGSAPLKTAIAGSQIASEVDTLPDLVELHRAGKIRVLGVSGMRRAPQLPDVPTFIEQGFREIAGLGWFGFYAPAGTPKPIVDRLNGAIVKALALPDVRERLSSLGLEPTGTTSEEFARIMAADAARWGPVIQASGFKAD